MIRLFSLFFLLFLSCVPAQDYSAIKVAEVIDGDTVRLVNGRLLRYIGIDTPEIRIKKNGNFVYSPQPFSLEAKKFNQELVEGKAVRVEFDLERYDRYGRLLGYCFVNGDFVNARLLEEGYASLYAFPPNIKYVELFVALQKKAKKAGKGLWGGDRMISHTEAHDYLNQIRSVRGKVRGIYRSAKCLFLNFGRNYKTDFTIVIFDNSLKLFRERGIDPLTFYTGKTVEASGRIREYNGPEIIVNTPDEIEVLE